MLAAGVLPAQAQTVDICDRTAQVRDAILEELGADDCAAVDSDRLARVSYLNLNGKQLTALAGGDFAGLTGLYQLYLHYNQLTALPDGVFDGLTSLQTMGLENNQLTALPADMFDSLTRLSYLNLSWNQLTTFPADMFDSLTRLSYLNLASNQLTKFPDGVDGLTSLWNLDLAGNQLTTFPDGVFDGLTSLRGLYLHYNRFTTLPDGVFDRLTSLQALWLDQNEFTTLPDGVFDSLTNLNQLDLRLNPLTALPDGVFDRLTSLRELDVGARFTTLPDGVFDRLTSLRDLGVYSIELPDGVFDSLTSLQVLRLGRTCLFFSFLCDRIALPDGVFDRLTGLRELRLESADLTTLPDGVFNSLIRLQRLDLAVNGLTVLPDGVFDGLTSLQSLILSRNLLRTLPDGVFDGLTSLQSLILRHNLLRTLPDGVFDGLTSLRVLDLRGANQLVGLTRNDPLFAGFSRGVGIWLDGGDHDPGQTRLAAAVPLMLSTADSTRHGFVRIVNESAQSGSVRVFAFDDSGHAPDPIEIPLDAGQVVHFNSNDLENGNADKGIEGGVGSPVRGDWTLDIKTDLPVRVLAFVRHGDGFLTAMHDVLPRNDEGRMVAHTFNPGSNMTQASSLRLVNIGLNDESVSIAGVDDQGNNAGPVTLTLPAGESRTLSAFDIENGAQGLTGTLGDGAAKWRLFIRAGRSVVGMSLLESTNNGHLTNISTAGVAEDWEPWSYVVGILAAETDEELASRHGRAWRATPTERDVGRSAGGMPRDMLGANAP